MKKFFNWLKSTSKHKYINGGKGVISIFLALVMVPFATMSDLLIEAARYRSSQSVLEEIMDSSIYSTLSHYDSYLQNRFGLLAIDQSINMNDSFCEYLLKNTGSLTTWDIDKYDVSVTGLYPLSENKALMNQICEISKFSAPASIAGSALSEILDSIKGLTQVANIFSLIGSVGDTVNSTLTVAYDLKDLKSMSEGVATAVNTYNSKYNNFKSAVATLAGKISDYQSKRNKYNSELEKVTSSNQQLVSLKEDKNNKEKEIDKLEEEYLNKKVDKNQYEKSLSEYNKELEEIEKQIEELTEECSKKNKALESAKKAMDEAEEKISIEKTNVDTKKTEYADSIQDLKDKLSTYSSKADELLSDFTEVVSSTADLKVNAGKVGVDYVTSEEKKKAGYDDLVEKKKNEESKLSSAKTEEEKSEIQQKIDSYSTQIESIDNSVNSTSTAYSNASKTYKESADALENTNNELKEALKDHNKDAISNCITNLGTLKNKVNGFNTNSVKTNTVITTSNYYESIPSYATASAIQNALDKAKDKLFKNGGFDCIKSLINIFNAITTTQGVFDPRLNAYINEETGYTPTDIDLVLNSMTDMIQSVETIADGFGSLNIFEMLEGFVNLCASVAEFTVNLINYLVGLVTRLVQCVGEIFSSKVGDKVLLDEYLIRNLSNRTNVNNTGHISGSADYTGYSYSSVQFEESGLANAIPTVGNLVALIDVLKGVATGGNNKMFCGAELEYILVGSKSEVLNQTAVFFQLYFVRLLFDAFSVFSNTEVEAIAAAVAAATVGIGGFVVKLIIALVEPFLDTLVLVNGGDIPIYKSYVFLTPTGLPKLIGKLSYMKLTKAQEDVIKKECKDGLKIGDAKDSSTGDSGFGLKYDQYLLILMFLTGENNEYINRFQNIIQLECNAYYEKKSKPFSINNTYTYLDVTVAGEFVPILPLGDIVYNNLFDSTQHEIRGY